MFDCKKAIEKGICKGDCCGPVPLKKEVVKKFEHLAQREVKEVVEFSDTEVFPITEDLMCVFLDQNLQCVIYDHRPDVCRNFGTTDDVRLQCPHLKQNGNFRSEAQKKRVMRAMKRFQHDNLSGNRRVCRVSAFTRE